MTPVGNRLQTHSDDDPVTKFRAESMVWHDSINMRLVMPTVTCAALWFGVYGVLLVLDDPNLGGAGYPLMMFCIAFISLSGCVVGALHFANRTGDAPMGWTQVLGCLLLSVAMVSIWPDSAAVAPVHGFLLLWGGVCLGRLLGEKWTDPAHLWPLVLVAMSFDVWSVLAAHGMTHQIIESAQALDAPLLNPLMIVMPIPGYGLNPILGAGDLVFSGFVVGGVSALGLSHIRSLLGLFLGLLLTLLMLLVFNVPIPALPIIGPMMAMSLGNSVRPRGRDLLGALAFVVVGLSCLHWGVALN